MNLKTKLFFFTIILLLVVGCKSVENSKKNKNDISEIKTEVSKNKIQLSKIDLDSKEITFIVADPKEETVFTDEKGKTQTFKNVKEVKISNKKEIKKDSIVDSDKKTSENKTDKSIINETAKSTSDAKNFKGMFFYSFLIVLIIFISYLIYKFKK
jgi:ATP-dependent Zn protease